MARAPRVSKVAVAEPKPAAPERRKRTNRNPEFEVALGARIRTARIAARMSQGVLGKAVGISYQQMQKYELGKDRIAVSTLHAIAAALGVHPGTFFDADMPAPIGRSIPDVKRVIRSADVLGQIRDTRVLRQLLALAKVLAGTDDEKVEQPAVASDGTP